MIANGQLADATDFNAAFMSRTVDTTSIGYIGTSKYFLTGSDDAKTAHAGGGQGSALAITKGFTRFTTVATAADSAKLPSGIAGAMLFVVNAGANAMDVFPATGEQINGLAANTALSVLAGQTALFVCRATSQWVEVLASPLTLNAVSGSVASPNLITAGGVIPIIAGALRQAVFIAGSAAAVTTGGVHITAGTIVGQELTLISTSATNTVTITDGDGTGTEANGDIVHGLRTVSKWFWDGTRWVEISRNDL